MRMTSCIWQVYSSNLIRSLVISWPMENYSTFLSSNCLHQELWWNISDSSRSTDLPRSLSPAQNSLWDDDISPRCHLPPHPPPKTPLQSLSATSEEKKSYTGSTAVFQFALLLRITAKPPHFPEIQPCFSPLISYSIHWRVHQNTKNQLQNRNKAFSSSAPSPWCGQQREEGQSAANTLQMFHQGYIAYFCPSFVPTPFQISRSTY